MTRVAIYVRVSTTEQTTQNQTQTLTEIAGKHNWEVTSVYEDNGISGTKGRDQRPAFNQMCTDMANSVFDRIMVWDISRLGRSLKNLVEFLSELQNHKCDLYVHQSGLDTSSPSGRMMFQIVGVFSEFERSMISERVKLGLKRVKSNGTKLGRPTKIGIEQKLKIWSLIDEGRTLSEVSRLLQISKMSISRINRERNPGH